MKNLEEVLKAFPTSHLTLRLSKCYLFRSQITYLGHEISSEGIRPETTKIDQNFSVPKGVREIRQFLGLSSYFRKYVKNFATNARPLTSLTRKDVEFCWNDAQQNAFATLKEKLISRPILALYDPGS